MKRRVALMAVAASFALLAAACTAGGGTDEPPPSIDPNAQHDPVTLEMWIPFSADHEVAGVQATFDAFEAKYPWITIKVTTGVEDDAKVLAAIRAGTPPDATMSWALDDLAAFCDTGAWQDLTPYIEQDGMVLSAVFPPSVERYTGFGGKRCAFPFLTDAVGLYYNKDLLEAKGYTEPPKTYSELTKMAKDLTEFNPDGTIKVAGFVPWFGNYYVNGDPLNHSIAWDADWYNDDGTAAMATDPDWAAMFRWQKDLVDFYGVDNLKKFVAGQGDEWGESSQDFQQGRIAMALDGEWRTAFIKNGTPNLNYGTAPAPVPDGKEDLYGIGRVGGTIIGIPRGSAHEAEAWLLVKFMATNTDSLVAAANAIGNVPTTLDSLASPDLSLPPQFDTFLDVFSNPNSHYKEMSVLGSADQDLLSSFAAKWQAGRITNLEDGLADVAQQIDDQLAQAGG
jgi:multiple sugar transport system substrate-binding protein